MTIDRQDIEREVGKLHLDRRDGWNIITRNLIAEVHKTANDAGWYRDPETGDTVERNFGEVVALMHSEISEAHEADETDAADDKLPHRAGVEVELADLLIRIMDTSAARGYDLAGETCRQLEEWEPCTSRTGHVFCLMHRGLSEALEADRKSVEGGQVKGFAKCILRAMELAERRQYDLVGAILEKNEFNKRRADHRLENRANGGKRY